LGYISVVESLGIYR